MASLSDRGYAANAAHPLRDRAKASDVLVVPVDAVERVRVPEPVPEIDKRLRSDHVQQPLQKDLVEPCP